MLTQVAHLVENAIPKVCWSSVETVQQVALFSMTMCKVLHVSNEFDLLLTQQSAGASLVVERMTSCILMLGVTICFILAEG